MGGGGSIWTTTVSLLLLGRRHLSRKVQRALRRWTARAQGQAPRVRPPYRGQLPTPTQSGLMLSAGKSVHHETSRVLVLPLVSKKEGERLAAEGWRVLDARWNVALDLCRRGLRLQGALKGERCRALPCRNGHGSFGGHELEIRFSIFFFKKSQPPGVFVFWSRAHRIAVVWLFWHYTTTLGGVGSQSYRSFAQVRTCQNAIGRQLTFTNAAWAYKIYHEFADNHNTTMIFVSPASNPPFSTAHSFDRDCHFSPSQQRRQRRQQAAAIFSCRG